MTYLSTLPYDIEKHIYRNVHEMNIVDVMSQLKKEIWQMNNILFYLLVKSSCYPYLIRFKLYKHYYFKGTSLYCRNKVYRYIHYKLFSRCLQSIIKI